MCCLLILAHPRRDSLCGALFDACVDGAPMGGTPGFGLPHLVGHLPGRRENGRTAVKAVLAWLNIVTVTGSDGMAALRCQVRRSA
ncbi:hypothetical protein ACVC7V_12390 [Hydrogenophaga sp. A37]|uniref:hypothetical protein n=1 Tax=Hydrogenophaga sp. A37 TaxID=1945864 RepID=UPI0009844B50|nr:hypothetical protein [Hydrogenophaga sp. A37]OOG81393.1 hypothetical protein B0E41_18295 [Hydrogenophaga sp. A37]